MSKGKKFDEGKLRWLLLPLVAVREVVRVLEFGAKKYGADNWQGLPNAEDRYLNACLRHIVAYREGEVLDHESGLHHLAHAACCLLFVIYLDKRGKK